jgi:chromosome segregation ATPase
MNLKTPGPPGRGVIRGVELQDFMSYDHAEVPLVPGLNLICGPNGAGKSSLLLGISLVLGQASTERSRRLADLIRWGRPEARISLVLDNHLGDGARLFPQRKEERVTLTRVLRRNGEYFYQIQGQAVPKADVQEALGRVGIYPDNMLIVMHQLMVHRFASVAPAEKLRMLEEAVGLRSYREEVLEALGRGRSAGEEERTLSAVLQSTQQTYDYWMKEYQRWQRKQALEARLLALEAEAAWGRVTVREAAVGRLKSRLEATRAE